MIKVLPLVILGLWLLIMQTACDSKMQKLPDGHEISSQIAPDRFSRAFVWTPELDGLGATVSQPYQVWMQNLQKDKQESLIFQSDKTDGLKLTWKDQNTLEICYSRAQITYFRNFFVVAEQNSPQIYRIEVVLRKVPKFDDC